MKQEELKQILPHRDAMLLIEEAELRHGKAYGRRKIYGDEWFLQGHFPENPIVPGVILCEILAQSACVLMADIMTDGKLPVYTGLNNVKFRNSVRPGDTIETRCTIKRAKHPFYFAEGTVTVDGKICVSAEFSFAITAAPAGE